MLIIVPLPNRYPGGFSQDIDLFCGNHFKTSYDHWQDHDAPTLGRFMNRSNVGRPNGGRIDYDNSMEMVGHDLEDVNINVWIMTGYFFPAFFDDFSLFIQKDFTVFDMTQ
jgi:hypothetical protein